MRACASLPHVVVDPTGEQHDVPLGRAPQRALRPERLRVVGVDALSPEPVAQVIRESLLNQPVFAVDVGDHRRLSDCLRDFGHRPNGTLQIELVELPLSQHRPQLRIQLRSQPRPSFR